MTDTKTDEQAAAVENPLLRTVDLTYPLTFEGRTIAQVCLDLSLLTSDALERAEQHYMRSGGIPAMAELTLQYCAYCAAEAAGLPYEAVRKLVGPDYMEVCLIVQNFLLGTLSRVAR